MDENKVKMNKNPITFGKKNTLLHHQYQMKRKIKEIEGLLSGRNQPLLPKDWTDEDAWALARDLAKIME